VEEHTIQEEGTMQLGEKRMIRTIKLQSFLSFGSTAEETDLLSLNVLIGPNASGKSNLIEAVGFLRSSPKDLSIPIRDGGGVSEWLWKGTDASPVAKIDVTVCFPSGRMPLRHTIAFTMVGQRFELVDESVENEHARPAHGEDAYFYYRYQQGRPAIQVCIEADETTDTDGRPQRRLRREDNIKHDQSIMSQRQGPEYPEISYLSSQYSMIRLYREWNLGRYTPSRVPQKVDLPEDFLEEDASNLGLVLNDLEHKVGFRNLLIERLKQFHESFSDVSTKLHGGTVQIFLHENNLRQPIPATRLSDGTLRFLCLMSVLCHPSPPPLICIEEPEIGLHPDVLPMVAELLVEASHNTQLIVTTHSDVLVDALTSVPESVVVCEKHNGSTVLRRLQADELKPWLAKYRLGELWTRGDLGGTRW
jgi:predicted ATPase